VLTSRRFGSGTPLVALHGFTHTGEQYRALAEATDREIHAPDLPGHGSSADKSTMIDDVLASLSETIAAEGADAPILGYSQGARLALLLATQTSSVKGRLILVSGTAGIEDESEGLPAALRKSDREERLANTAHGLASALTGYGTGTMPSVWHVLNTITVPTLILTGSRDTTYTAHGERLASGIGPNASHRIIDGAGHDLLLSGLTATAAHISEFLA
jgi:2-succinyl-6-hydroxy-2,4-cyclohexadiene-1-carboxylate synthase